MSDIIISLDKVRKVYFLDTVEVEALKDISLDIHAGDFVSIAGPSGSGKTTILNLIGCVDKPTLGTVIIHGKRTSDLDDDSLTELRHKSIGFISRASTLFPCSIFARTWSCLSFWTAGREANTRPTAKTGWTTS